MLFEDVPAERLHLALEHHAKLSTFKPKVEAPDAREE